MTAKYSNGPTPAGLMRLHQLFFLLSIVPQNKISLNKWRFDTGTGGVDVSDEKLSTDCRTVACAVGWACMHPPFIKEGFSWNHETQVPKFVNTKVPEGQNPITNGSWGAIEAFFQLNNGESHSLFDAPTTTELRVLKGWSHRDIARNRLHAYLAGNGLTMSTFDRIDAPEVV